MNRQRRSRAPAPVLPGGGRGGGRQSLGNRSLHLEIILELFVANTGNLPFVLSPCHWHSGAASPRTSCVPLLEVAGGVGGATLCKALHEPQRPNHAAPGSTTPSLRGAPHSKGQFTGSRPSPPGAPSLSLPSSWLVSGRAWRAEAGSLWTHRLARAPLPGKSPWSRKTGRGRLVSCPRS